jgi:TolA-binding protein
VVASALLLSGCSFPDTLWPSLTGENPGGDAARQSKAAPTPATTAAAVTPTPVGAPPALGSGNFQPPGVTAGVSTGTFVGRKVVELRNELKKLQSSIAANNVTLQRLRARMVQDSQRYHGTVAAVNTRLQVGTTPGNPVLVQQYNSALTDLDRLAADIGGMNKLATSVTGNATMAAFLAESTRAAFSVSGAVDEDHRQLSILEDEVNRTVVLIERLLTELSDDIRRQTNYVATERSNLNLLSAGIKGGEIYGASLINRAMASAAASNFGRSLRAADTSGRRPLVVIRFNRNKVPYQQALYNAVSRVLERRPNAVFDLVAVAPASGGPARVALNSNKARRYAEDVLRSLVEMGLPPTRVAVSAKTSRTAKTNEVHLYLR